MNIIITFTAPLIRLRRMALYEFILIDWLIDTLRKVLLYDDERDPPAIAKFLVDGRSLQ